MNGLSNYHIYFPRDLLRRKIKSKSTYIIGFKLNNVYIATQLSQTIDHFNEVIRKNDLLKDLKVIGTINRHETSIDLNFTYKTNDIYPIINHDQKSNKYTVILFDPPNFKNLEYFSINPILLQSTGSKKVPRDKLPDRTLVDKLNEYTPKSLDSSMFSISDDKVLDKINQCLRVRNIYDSLTKSQKTDIKKHNKFISVVEAQVFHMLTILVLSLQLLTIWLIKAINYKILNHKLTNVLEVFKQLDLRLRQINYFPIQFLCYYDKSILYNKNSQFLKSIEIPFLNSDLNINNSNYINLYNSIWLIVNDFLLGITFYKVIFENFDIIINFIDEIIIKKLLFLDLYSLINWVSFDHPAGFKLNNELGQFMGNLFLWTLKFWKLLIDNILGMENFQIKEISQVTIKILCYFGLTFLLSAIIDYIKLITLHLNCFYFTLAKIYNRQIETIKSLFQLFRGKKYNTLRDRVDNLDLINNFEIDQLLVGTLLFIILIYLLPTIFAFYLMFSTIRIGSLLSRKIIESCVTFINFIPLFVILLKFKNSNRLQGGITFDYLINLNGTNYLIFLNKSLTYNEILKNFRKLIKKNNLRELNLIKCFFTGQVIKLHEFKILKFNYLMLPKNFDRTIEVWNYFSKKGEPVS